MRLLLDECVPKRLKRELPGRDARTVQDLGWAGIKNGALLRLANGERYTDGAGLVFPFWLVRAVSGYRGNRGQRGGSERR